MSADGDSDTPIPAPPPGKDSGSGSQLLTWVLPVPCGRRRWAARRLIITFLAIRKSQLRNFPRDGSGSHRSMAPLTATKTSNVNC